MSNKRNSKFFRSTVDSNSKSSSDTENKYEDYLKDKKFIKKAQEIQKRIDNGELRQNLKTDEVRIYDIWIKIKKMYEKAKQEQDAIREIATEQIKFLLNNANFSNITNLIEEQMKNLSIVKRKQNINILPYGERRYTIPYTIQGFIKTGAEGIYPFEQLGKLLEKNEFYNSYKENQYIANMFNGFNDYLHKVFNTGENIYNNKMTENTKRGLAMIRNILSDKVRNENGENYIIKINHIEDIIDKLDNNDYYPEEFQNEFTVYKDSESKKLLNSIPVNDYNSYWMGSIDNLLSNINSNSINEDEYKNYQREIENYNIFKEHEKNITKLKEIWNDKNDDWYDKVLAVPENKILDFRLYVENILHNYFGEGGFGVVKYIDSNSLNDESKKEMNSIIKKLEIINKEINELISTKNGIETKLALLEQTNKHVDSDGVFTEEVIDLQTKLAEINTLGESKENERYKLESMLEMKTNPFNIHEDSLKKLYKKGSRFYEYLVSPGVYSENYDTDPVGYTQYLFKDYNINNSKYRELNPQIIKQMYITRMLPQFFNIKEHIQHSKYDLLNSQDRIEWDNIQREFAPIIKFSKKNFLPLSLLNRPIETLNFIIDDFDSNEVGNILRVIKNTNPTYLKNAQSIIKDYFLNDLNKYKQKLLEMSLDDFDYTNILEDVNDEKLFILLKNMKQDLTNEELENYGSSINQKLVEYTNDLSSALTEFNISKNHVEQMLQKADKKIVDAYNNLVNLHLENTEEEFEKNKEKYIDIIKDNPDLFNAINENMERQKLLIEKMSEYKNFVQNNPTFKNDIEVQNIIETVKGIIDSQTYVKNFKNENLRNFFRETIRGWGIIGENNPFLSEHLTEEQRREYEFAQNEQKQEDIKAQVNIIRNMFKEDKSLDSFVLIARLEEELNKTKEEHLNLEKDHLNQLAENEKEILKYKHLNEKYNSEKEQYQIQKETLEIENKKLKSTIEAIRRNEIERQKQQEERIDDIIKTKEKMINDLQEEINKIRESNIKDKGEKEKQIHDQTLDIQKQTNELEKIKKEHQVALNKIKDLEKDIKDYNAKDVEEIANIKKLTDERINKYKEEYKTLEEEYKTKYKEMEDKEKSIHNYYENLLKEKENKYKEEISKQHNNLYDQFEAFSKGKIEEKEKEYKTKEDEFTQKINNLNKEITDLRKEIKTKIDKSPEFRKAVDNEIKKEKEEIENRIKKLTDERDTILYQRNEYEERIKNLEKEEKIVNKVISINEIRDMFENNQKKNDEQSQLFKKVAETILEKFEKNMNEIKQNPNMSEDDFNKIKNLVESNVTKFIGNEKLLEELKTGTIENMKNLFKEHEEEQKRIQKNREEFLNNTVSKIANVNSKLIDNLGNLSQTLNDNAQNIKKYSLDVTKTYTDPILSNVKNLYKAIDEFIPKNREMFEKSVEQNKVLKEGVDNMKTIVKDIQDKGVKINVDEVNKSIENMMKDTKNEILKIQKEINTAKLEERVLEGRKEKWDSIFNINNADQLKQKLNQIYTETKMPEEREEDYFKKRFSQTKLKETFGLDNNYPDINYSDVKNYLPEQFFRDMNDFLESKNKNKPVVKLYTTNYEPTAKSSGFSDNTKRRLLKLYYYFKDPKMRTSKKNELPRNFLQDLSMLSNFSEKDVEKKYAQFLRTGFF